MSYPKMWNIKPLPHYTFINVIDYKKTDTPKVVKNHYFNHSISITIPNIVPQELYNCLSKDTDYYQINGLRISDLLNIEFIEAFVKKGEINLLTIENKLDLENSICLTPTGCLVLSLLRKDYQGLGLKGKVSDFTSRRYVVKIDLTNENFIPGKKNYERVRIALEERFKETFDVIVWWDPPELNVCPSSIAAWFYERNYKISLCRQQFFQRTKYSLTIPTYENRCDKTDIDFFEWLGIFSIDGDLSSETEDYVNSYRCPSPSVEVEQVHYLQWTGFFTRKKIQEVYNVLKKYVLSQNLLWISIDVQGFADSPINFNLKEHMFLTEGDNSYTIVFRSDQAVIQKNLTFISKKG